MTGAARLLAGFREWTTAEHQQAIMVENTLRLE
jgi:hypothetical protein